MFSHINALSIDKKLMDLLISCEIECIIHSVFQRAINLKSFGGDMISIVSGGNGPNTIVVPEKFNFTQVPLNTFVTCSDQGIFFYKGLFVSFNKIFLWEYVPGEINTCNLKENLLYVLSFFSSQPCLEPQEIIREKLLSIQSLSAATMLYESIISLIKAIKDNSRGRINSSLSRIIGTGEGLTPAGDDFSVGLLGVLYYFKRTLKYGERARNILDIIKEEIDIEKTNFISSRFLSFSLEGRFSQTVLEFLDILFSPEPVIEKPLRNLLSYGASSGTATVLGILSGILLFVDNMLYV
jgi:hypothetical protein